MKEPIFIEPMNYQCTYCGCSHTTREGALACRCRMDKESQFISKQKVRDAIDNILMKQAATNWKELNHSGGFIRFSLFKELNLGD